MPDELSKRTNEKYMHECVESLGACGWWFSPCEWTQDAFDIADCSSWVGFADHWNHLLLDEYMRDGGTYRFRRYSAFEFDTEAGSFRLLPNAPYEQSKSINKLNGGFLRYFEPLERTFVEHPILDKILKGVGRIVSKTTGHRHWNVKLHPYRIVARGSVSGLPAPEGLHQDGVDFIVSYMIGRLNVVGGVNTVTDTGKQPIGTVEMMRPNDFLVCDDRKTYHDVSPIVAEKRKKPFAYRDVLVLAFEKI
ncbi:2OG-Fe dioxygenase family protein [Mesorhizobium sp. Cs1299R1N1]|uniref:2OG-Fe dioxygenase family protein n=1 Tax=unclassified Mesorhizobium TaxID=325217 RepID=UPI00301B8CDA